MTSTLTIFETLLSSALAFVASTRSQVTETGGPYGAPKRRRSSGTACQGAAIASVRGRSPLVAARETRVEHLIVTNDSMVRVDGRVA
jgi:hypothetical protein